MLWKNRRMSGNVLDQRRMGAGSMGIGGLILGAVVVYLSGGNPMDYLVQNSVNVQRQEVSPQSEEQKNFVAVVLADTEDVWNEIFRRNNLRYEEPKLVLFSQMTRSACGSASSAVGPFYCPGDKQVYLDLSFFRQLSNSLGAQGDFASAYVIAHEVGHHVQNLLGVERAFRRDMEGLGERERNRLSVKMELQADCLAGVTTRHIQSTKNVLESGDLEEAMNAASAVGDDKLQQASSGQVVPDSFTHGSSADRVRAFKVGYQDGQPQACLETFR